MFEHVEPFGGDPILSLNEDFQKDPRPGKINLSIGIYFDDAGRIPVLGSVRRAEQQVVARDAPKPYLPIEGAANFRAAVQALLFGTGHEAIASGRVATIQSVGSSGGLKVGADFIARWLPGSEGEGVADVLYGHRPFTGKLPVSWPRTLSQEPINIGDRHYDPLFPYGYGLTTHTGRGHRH